jgi:hypothetical protein
LRYFGEHSKPAELEWYLSGSFEECQDLWSPGMKADTEGKGLQKKAALPLVWNALLLRIKKK